MSKKAVQGADRCLGETPRLSVKDYFQLGVLIKEGLMRVCQQNFK